MAPVIYVLAISAACFCAMVISLAAKPKFVAKLTCAAAAITGIGGLLTYSYGYSLTGSSGLLAIIRTVTATCGMFLGRSDFSAVKGTPFFSLPLGEASFYLLHLIAMYATASAAITTVGATLLQKIRMFLSRWGHLVIIYGVHEDSVAFGKAISSEKGNTIVYVGDPAPGCANMIHTSAGVLRTDAAAMTPGKALLRSLGIRPGKRDITLYALSHDQSANLSYATAFGKALEAGNILPSQTRLVLLSTEEEMQSILQNEPDNHYGYGNVCVMDEADMAARLLISKYPPVQTLQFDEAGRAREDFTGLILGFGKIGQAVLQQLVMHGQFAGSTFQVDIFDPKCSQVSGGLLSRSSQLLDHYAVHLHDADARSSQLYTYLKSHPQGPKYVVICTGSSRGNEEIAFDLLNYFSRSHVLTPIFLCDYSGVKCMTCGALPIKHPLFSPDVLVQNSLDRMGMALNQTYMGSNGRTAEENWAACSPMNRMSSRASADFAPAFLHIAKVSREDAMKAGGWQPKDPLLENLGITEHLRWCAFHYVMGYTLMSDEIFQARGEAYRKNFAEYQEQVSQQYAEGTEEYQQALKKRNKKNVRIAKDNEKRLHACLVDWDALDVLTEKEKQYTHDEKLDYKQLDKDIVLDVPKLLRAALSEAERKALETQQQNG